MENSTPNALLIVMANATISPSLPGLATTFADTPGIETLAGMVLSLPSLAIILTAALFRWLADRIDRRKLLPAVMVVYALGGASALLASTMSEILAGRSVLGIGVAGTMTLVTKLAADLWSGQARAQFLVGKQPRCQAVALSSCSPVARWPRSAGAVPLRSTELPFHLRSSWLLSSPNRHRRPT